MNHMRFHDHHGRNIQISRDGLTASRVCSFSHGLCFGDRPLMPGEIFLVEITSRESGWSGHIRIGLTSHDPNGRFELPQYALPDLVHTIGGSWLWAMTKQPQFNFSPEDYNDPENRNNYFLPELRHDQKSQKCVTVNGNWIHTSFRKYNRMLFLPNKLRHQSVQDQIGEPDDLPDQQYQTTDVGSRIGILYTRNEGKCNISLIINGDEHGPVVKDIITSGPLWPLLDVYGITNQVQIVKLPVGDSLQALCRERIVKCLHSSKEIKELQIPVKLKEYLAYVT